MIPDKYRLKNTIKYPTSLIIGGLNRLGLEIADSLIQQGGYVVIVDTYTKETESALSVFENTNLISFLDYSAIPHLDEDIKRLDYIFFFQHNSNDLDQKIPTSEFLELSNYLDSALNLAKKFNAKFLLTTSIKAHQMVLTKQDLSLDFGYGMSSRKHTVYSEMEFQKYAESLTMEYFEREDLDVKIVRLAEIIGDGIDFNKETDFTEILLDAVTNHQIRLKKDGLNSDWYVHILDASYGIIKAQFSRITKGEIYSLAYETPYTNLSFAYKIQEFDSDVKEIVFVQETDNLPDLKFYKPAPNLSTIGWSARVDFDQAVKQSLASAKIHVLENNSVSIKKTKGTLVDKIRGFLTIAEKESIGSSESGAITRLIAERKKQDDLKKLSVKSANISIKNKSKRKKGVKEKISDTAWVGFRKLGEKFNIFKDKNPIQITGIILLFAFLIFIYANFFAPIIALARNIVILYPEVEALSTEVDKGNIAKAEGYLNTVIYHTQDSKEILKKFEAIFNLFGASKPYKEISKSLDSYILFLDGLQNLAKGFKPFQSYLRDLTNNTVIRASSDSYLSISSQGVDSTQNLSSLNSFIPFVDSGLLKIQKASTNLSFVDLTVLPEFLTNQLGKINSKISQTVNNLKNISALKYSDSILGVDSDKTYMFYLLDNSIPATIGGNISGYVLATVSKGSLVDIVVQSVDDSNFKFNSLDSSDLDQINLRRLGLKNKSDLKLQDLSSVSDIDALFNISKKFIKENTTKDLHGVATINLTSLENLSKAIALNLNKSLEINSIVLSDFDFFKQVKTLAGGSDSLRSKNALITQISGFVFNNIIDLFKKSPSVVLNTLALDNSSRDIVFSSPTLEYQEFVIANDLNQKELLNNLIPLDITFTATDPTFKGLDIVPSFTTAIESTINNDFSVNNKLNFRFQEFNIAGVVSVCFPANIADSQIQVSGLSGLRYISATVQNKKCINIQIINESQINVSWVTPQLGRILSESQREISYGILKNRGSLSTIDMQINLANELSLVNFVPQAGQNSAPVVFTSKNKSDLPAVIVVEK